MAPPIRIKAQEDSFIDYLGQNVWVPILALSAAVLIIIFVIYCVWRCRNRMRYDYSILKADLALPQRLEMERKLQYDTMRETALLHCQFYLRSSGLYTPGEHLPEMGSRINKHWFLVRDTRSKVEKLLTMFPKSAHMVLPFTSSTKTTVLTLLHAIQHPYIYPIYDLDILPEQDRIVVILPYNTKGSIKDVIYHAHCTESWGSKYHLAGTGLPTTLVATYGRQILEGLLYLQKSGFPPNSHLHSGNVIVQNNTCRLTGYENELFDLSSKMYGITTKVLRDDKAAVEVVCFGHLLYEMFVGNELEVTIPDVRHLEVVTDVSLRQCLEYIFSSTAEGFHTLEQIAEHPFFTRVALKELEVFKRPPVKFSKSQKALLKTVRRSRLPQRKVHAAPNPHKVPLQQADRRRGGYGHQDEGQTRSAVPMPQLLTKGDIPGNLQPPLVPRQSPPQPSSMKPAVPTVKPKVPSRKLKPASTRAGPSPGPSTPGAPSVPGGVAAPPLPPSDSSRAALLSQIRQGATLKKTSSRS